MSKVEYIVVNIISTFLNCLAAVAYVKIYIKAPSDRGV